MFNLNYLNGTDYQDFGINGIYLIKHHLGGDRFRLVCDYKTGSGNKKTLMGILRYIEAEVNKLEKAANPNYSPKKNYTVMKYWHFHHVVERQHYANVDFEGKVKQMYKYDLPCVLIYNPEEHAVYTKTARSGASNAFFHSKGLPGRWQDRSDYSARQAKTREGRKKIIERINNLKFWYRNFYSGDEVLQTIASNVFEEARRRIDNYF